MNKKKADMIKTVSTLGLIAIIFALLTFLQMQEMKKQ